jgi:transcriptional/translational regulatory protein YebC/TACO1
MEAALDAGAEDVVSGEDGSVDVLTTPDAFESVRDALAAAGLVAETAEVTMRATTACKLDAADGEKMIRLLERLEDLDDVQNVYSNADISEEILAKIG